jgi:peptidyl-prolyl cis-trans isomerase C
MDQLMDTQTDETTTDHVRAMHVEDSMKTYYNRTAEALKPFFDKFNTACDFLAPFGFVLGHGAAWATFVAFGVACVAVLVRVVRHCFSSSKPGAPCVTARHIVVETEAQAAELKSMLSSKHGAALLEAFGEMAREFSMGCWSGANSGALGTLSPGKMSTAWDAAAWSAPLMTVQGPVQTDAGFHLILVLQRQGSLTAGNEEAKKDL